MKINGTPEEDFFKANPQLKYLAEFKPVWEKYGLSEASKIFWAIDTIENPDSQLSGLPKNQRVKQVTEGFGLDQKEFENSATIKHARKFYIELFVSKEEWAFKVVSDKVDSLFAFMEELTVTGPDEFDAVSKMMERYEKILDLYEKAEKRLKAKNQNKRGGGNLPPSETGELFTGFKKP